MNMTPTNPPSGQHWTDRFQGRAEMYGELSDAEIATKVRMLVRNDLDHEPVVQAARDRIARLSRQNRDLTSTLAESAAENNRLKQRLLTAAGDDLCRLTQEEIKDLTGGKVPIPPRDEFLASCERFHSQIAGEAGVNHNCLTLAQLIAENERLTAELAALRAPGDASEEAAGTTFHECVKAAIKECGMLGVQASWIGLGDRERAFFMGMAHSFRSPLLAQIAELRQGNATLLDERDRTRDMLWQSEASGKAMREAKEAAERERDEKQRKLDRAHTRIGELDHELGNGGAHKLREELGKAREENGEAWDAVLENHPEAENSNLTLAEAIADAIVSAHDDLADAKSEKARVERESATLRTRLAAVERACTPILTPLYVRRLRGEPDRLEAINTGLLVYGRLLDLEAAFSKTPAPPAAEPGACPQCSSREVEPIGDISGKLLYRECMACHWKSAAPAAAPAEAKGRKIVFEFDERSVETVESLRARGVEVLVIGQAGLAKCVGQAAKTQGVGR